MAIPKGYQGNASWRSWWGQWRVWGEPLENAPMCRLTLPLVYLPTYRVASDEKFVFPWHGRRTARVRKSRWEWGCRACCMNMLPSLHDCMLVSVQSKSPRHSQEVEVFWTTIPCSPRTSTTSPEAWERLVLAIFYRIFIRTLKRMRNICFSCPSLRSQSKDLWRPCMFRQTWECISLKIAAGLMGVPNRYKDA